MFLSRKFFLSLPVFLFMALLFTGCSMDDDVIGDGFPEHRLLGTWESEWDESYEITETHLRFTGFGDSSWGGRIMRITAFNENTGVLIIQYDADSKQQWTNWDTMEDITPAGRDFYGIYYRTQTVNSVIFSNTSDQENDWGPSETASLQEAVNRFTFDNMTNWVDLAFAAPFSRAP